MLNSALNLITLVRQECQCKYLSGHMLIDFRVLEVHLAGHRLMLSVLVLTF